MPRMYLGKSQGATPIHAVDAVPKAGLLHPARVEAGGSRRPNACPTRPAAAVLIPKGTKEVKLTVFKAI